MIQEDYCSFEVAKLLKDKGFLKGVDLRTTQNLSFYDNIGLTHNLNKWYDSLIQDKINFVVAPTHQMAMKWLREVYGIHVSAISCAERHTIVWQQNIINLKPIKEGGMFLQLEPHRKDYNSYEEAIDDEIKYSLENLI